MYTIFVNENVIYLDEKPADNVEILSFDFIDIKLEEVVTQLENDELKSIHIYHHNLKDLWENFQSQFKIIKAAGGVVFNEVNDSLWIYRNDKWDLPKGKIETDEDIEEAALREVEEECGVTNLELMGLITETYHLYKFKGKRILKITYWFKMTSIGQEKLTPQLEEGITKVEWVGTDKLDEVLKNTYRNIDLLCKFAIR